jgi:ATP-dependent exoDNAse (exonuclease V) beta subunit
MTSDIDTLRTQHLERQNSASNPVHSVWVSANAGAGKTHILVERIIRLLLPPYNCPLIRYFGIQYVF